MRAYQVPPPGRALELSFRRPRGRLLLGALHEGVAGASGRGYELLVSQEAGQVYPVNPLGYAPRQARTFGNPGSVFTPMYEHLSHGQTLFPSSQGPRCVTEGRAHEGHSQFAEHRRTWGTPALHSGSAASPGRPGLASSRSPFRRLFREASDFRQGRDLTRRTRAWKFFQ